MQIPQIQIRQQNARLGIDADPGQLVIKQPKATIEMQAIHPKLHIDAEQGKLYIDNRRVQDALGNGPHLEVMNRIYSKCKEIVLQGIAKKVEDGNRMAMIHTGEDAIVALALQSTQDLDFFEYMYVGDASFDNIDIRFEPGKFDIQVEEGRVDIHVQSNRPEVQYYPGKLDIYVSQYAQVEIIPPQMNIKI
ncbi:MULTISPECIES: DUF6470 family protein [unclassified Paenibacillus]|uniref:DUF6470 family protein n=1 Tax=unclassified Paenibacillus TaxID=185978 RepID=UPI001AE62C21|nr:MULTISPECIES: DUF6470 family protein [unclassified Paenibacillus]MBP1157804.1 hypothetical protein [Paenibacillus sp. PvP091]MBP1171460.1 hypothetical protein [Paenibacillus sp. PvR098]MBP2442488.1 hypothetical protein [Paenibacillus sp. PvP052]